MGKNITKDYKKTADNTVKMVDTKDKQTAEKLELDDRIYSLSRREAFITLKDHKSNFENNPTCRLLNPAKSKLGKVSQKILARVVAQLRTKTKLNSWKNTHSVIDWFKNLKDKNTLSFIMFDICEFYPNITEEILRKALIYAKKHTNITQQEIDIILSTKSGLLFNGKQAWNKKGNTAFDVTMGSWDGAEVCDLIGLYLLSQLSDMNLEISLYRDDALAETASRPRQTEI